MNDETRMENAMPVQNAAPKRFTFFGSYNFNLDSKGRITVPTAYRKALGESFTITIGLDDRAIALYPDATFVEMVEALYRLNRRKPSVQRQQDHIAKFSYPGQQADQQGRVLLPARLRQYVLGDAKDVEISGALDHIRIVDRAAGAAEDDFYREHRDEILNEIAELEE